MGFVRPRSSSSHGPGPTATLSGLGRASAIAAAVRAASSGSQASITVTPSRDLQRGQSLRPDKAPVLKRIPHRSQWNISINSLCGTVS
jgi:hypothetical protein